MIKQVEINGKTVEMYTLGELALRIRRQTPTVRKWLWNGTLPEARWCLPRKRGFAAKNGGDRLYTKREIDAIQDVVEDMDFGKKTPGKWDELRRRLRDAVAEARKVDDILLS